MWTLVDTMSTPNHSKLVVSNRDGSADNQILSLMTWHEASRSWLIVKRRIYK